MQQVQMIPGPGPEPKIQVLYEGSDTLYNGYLLCANSDYGTDSVAERTRGTRAEKPATGNLHRFLGAVTGLGVAGKAGPCMVSLARPCGCLTQIHTDAACVVDTTELYIRPASYAASTRGRYRIARAAQTINRGTTAGLALVVLDGVQRSVPPVTASSRTAVQLPTAAIWDNFDLDELARNPFAGVLLNTDFRHDDGYPTQTHKDTSSTILPTNDVIGELAFFTTADNEAAEAQWLCPITVSGGNKWGFEARLKVSSVTTEKGSFEIGLSNAQTLAGDLQADGGATPTAGTDYVLWNHDAAATTALDLDYLLSGATHTEHDAALHTIVLNTYFTVGLYFDGTDIAQYCNGVVVADPILSTDIADGNFPAAQVCVPTIGVKGAHADDYTLTLDWIRAAQHA